jgi:superkiller protein 3
MGGRPVQTVFTDLGGRFSFDNVPRGSYSIRVEIDGFDTVTQPLQDYDLGMNVTVFVPLNRKPSTTTSGGGQTVDVSEYLKRYPKKAVSYFEKGSESLKKKKNDEAVKYLRNAVELAPNFYQAHNELGVAYRESGRLDDAEREFLAAHQLNAMGIEPLLNLTALYLQQNEPERAVTTGEEAVKVNSRSAFAFFNLGVALYKIAQLDRAESALKRALDLAPKMATVRLMLANVYLKLRRYDNTLEQLNAYIRENPKGQQIGDAVGMRDRLLQIKDTERP